MRYFFITQDKNLPGSIQYRDFDINGSRHVFSKEDSSQLDSVVALYLAGDGNEARWDFLQHPVTMFSRRFRNILDAYEPGLFFQEVVLIHKESSRQYQYVHTLMDQLDAVGSQTEYYPNGTVKRLVLDSGKIGQHNLFLLKGNQRKDPIVSLPLAESLLRRRPMGIHFEEVEVAQNTAYENFFTARDAVTAAGERVAAADEAVCLAEKKYMNGEISAEEWEATLQELSDAQVAETAANENYEAAAAGAQAAAEAVEAKKQELRDSRVNDTAYVVHCARIECPFGMRESYLALDATHGVLTHQIPQMTVKDMILNTNIINFGGCHSRENPDVQAEIEKTNAIIESKKDWRDDVVGYFTKKWNERVTIIKAGIGLAKKLLGMKKKEKTEEEKLEEMSSDFVGECKAQFPADGEWLEGHEKVFINGEPLLLRRCSIMCSYGGCVTILLSGQPE